MQIQRYESIGEFYTKLSEITEKPVAKPEIDALLNANRVYLKNQNPAIGWRLRQLDMPSYSLPVDLIGLIILQMKGKPKQVFKSLLLVSKQVNQYVLHFLPFWVSHHRVKINERQVSDYDFHMEQHLCPYFYNKLFFLRKDDSRFFKGPLLPQFPDLTGLHLDTLFTENELKTLSEMIKDLTKLQSLKFGFNGNSKVDKSLPLDFIPNHLTTLKVTRAKIHFLRTTFSIATQLQRLSLNFPLFNTPCTLNLPTTLTDLQLKSCFENLPPLELPRLTRLEMVDSGLPPAHLFSSISELKLAIGTFSTPLRELPVKLPTGLKRLDLEVYHFKKEDYDKIPVYTQTLLNFKLTIQKLKQDIIPSGVTELILSKSELYPQLPQSIRKLSLKLSAPLNNQVDFSNYDRLTNLKIYVNDTICHLELPKKLRRLKIQSCSKLKTLSRLPETLEKIFILYCNEMVLPQFTQAKIRSLKIEQHFRVVSINAFPATLEKLLIERCEILETIPSLAHTKLRKVRIRSCRALSTVLKLPDTTQILELTNAEKLDAWPNPLPRDLHTIIQKDEKQRLPPQPHRLIRFIGKDKIEYLKP